MDGPFRLWRSKLARCRRQDKLTSKIDRERLGLEIGPSHNPACPKRAGFKVEIIDHMSRDDLRRKYEGHGVDLDAIEAVDHIWNGESYLELTKKPKGYGWIVASHVIEHSPDLIRFLNDCDDVLADDGVLSLAIPDKRYCFDHLRPISSLASVIDAHEAKRTIHSAGTAADYFLNVCSIMPGADWKNSTPKSLSFVHTLDQAKAAVETSRAGTYLDLHAWCFTPASFRLLVADLNSLGMTKLQVDFWETGGHEFFVFLRRKADSQEKSRIDLATAVKDGN
jgi:hypothetical protein